MKVGKAALYSTVVTVVVGTIIFASRNPGEDTGEARPYFEGKNLNVIIGLGPSAGGTAIGRLVSKHLAEHIPGEPRLVVKNLEGAELMKAHQYVLRSAPDDGTVIYYGPRSPIGEMLELPGHEFKYTEFTALGGLQTAGLVIAARTDILPEGLKRPVDFLKADDLKYGGLYPEHGRMTITMLALDLLKADYTFVSGYPGSGKIRASLIQGEVNMATEETHAYRSSIEPQLVAKGEAMGIFHIPVLAEDGSLKKNPLAPEIPSFLEIYAEAIGGDPSGPSWDTMLELIRLDQTMAHVYLGPPGMNETAANIIREALIEALNSEEFKAEALQALSYAPEPVGYETSERILAATQTVDPATIEHLRKFLAEHM
jgi:tripartite-type tricarboxylate transporter receptor subunit TctC